MWPQAENDGQENDDRTSLVALTGLHQQRRAVFFFFSSVCLYALKRQFVFIAALMQFARQRFAFKLRLWFQIDERHSARENTDLASAAISDNGRAGRAAFPLGSLVVTSIDMPPWKRAGCTLTLFSDLLQKIRRERGAVCTVVSSFLHLSVDRSTYLVRIL